MNTSLNYIDNLSGRQFEKYIYQLFKSNPRYKARLTPASHDFGIDVIATDKYHPKYCTFRTIQHTYNLKGYTRNNEMLIHCKKTYGIQCKHTNGVAIGYKAVEEAISGAKYYKINNPVVLTNGLFTPHAKKGAKKTGVRLINRDKLIQLIKNYYKDIYKRMIQVNSKKGTLTLDKNLILNIKAMAQVVGANDESLILFNALDDFYHTKLTHGQRTKVLSNYDKLLNHN